MVTFMEEHGDLSKPTSCARGRIKSINRWEELAGLLNSDGTGDTKTVDRWKKVWSDLKNNTKRKAARLHRAATGTGGGPAATAKLTDLEQRVLAIVGVQAATGLVREAGLPPQTDSMESEESEELHIFSPVRRPGAAVAELSPPREPQRIITTPPTPDTHGSTYQPVEPAWRFFSASHSSTSTHTTTIYTTTIHTTTIHTTTSQSCQIRTLHSSTNHTTAEKDLAFSRSTISST